MINMKNVLLFIVGFVLLALSKIKVSLQGYKDPKPIKREDIDQSIEYDLLVVEHWLANLERYCGHSEIQGKRVLELGPGSDLGIGLKLLALGASEYHAFDVNPLINMTPPGFYERFFERLRFDGFEVSEIKKQFSFFTRGRKSRLNYVDDPSFDLEKHFDEKSIDLVFSQAAFEHFDDVNQTIKSLSRICRDGAILVAEIDLQAHSRWVRDNDPNSIYRFPKWLYRLVRYSGIPNRLRPFEYEQILGENGWAEIEVVPLKLVEPGSDACSGLHRDFREPENEMTKLTIMVTAKKKAC